MSILFGDIDKADKDLSLARFWTKAVEDVAGGAISGRPVFNDVPYITVRFRDDPFAVVSEPMRPEHKKRYPREWAAYEASQQQVGAGVPLERAPFMGPASVAALKASGVHTLERLVALGGDELERLGPGAVELQALARQYLQGDTKTVQELRATLKAKDAKIAELKGELEQLQGLLDKGRAA